MGCVTSKVLTKTGSFREELNRSLKRRHGAFPALQRLLSPRSKKGGEPILLIYNADDTSFESSTEDIKKTGEKDFNPETVDPWDLMEDLDEPSQLDEEGQTEHGSVHGTADITKQSQNPCLTLSDHKSSFMITEYGETNADIGIRSKSFHTVDEYDAIMNERNGWSAIEVKQDLEDGLADYLRNINKVLNLNSSTVAKPKSTCDEEDEMRRKTSAKMDTEDGNVSACTNDVVESTNDEIGVRRKAMAKDLSSLAIPSTIEFPVIGAEQNEGIVMQPYPSLDQNNYETPRFGTFGMPLSLKRDNLSVEEIQEASVFYPEMLSALEVAMQQLENEEDLLLKQIGNMLEDTKDYDLPPGIQG